MLLSPPMCPAPTPIAGFALIRSQPKSIGPATVAALVVSDIRTAKGGVMVADVSSDRSNAPVLDNVQTNTGRAQAPVLLSPAANP